MAVRFCESCAWENGTKTKTQVVHGKIVSWRECRVFILTTSVQLYSKGDFLTNLNVQHLISFHGLHNYADAVKSALEAIEVRIRLIHSNLQRTHILHN